MSNQKPLFEYTPPEKDVTGVESVKAFTVNPVLRKKIAWFIEKWHYSNNMNGVKSDYCFGLYANRALIGAAVFADPATKGVKEAYSENGKYKVTELRRLCCIDKTPKNTESYFIGFMLRWLKNNTDISIVLAYSDLTHGHVGTIYKATNFELVGQSPAVDKILYKGKTYHDRSLRVKYKGKLKNFSKKLAKALETGEATWIETKPKNIYLYKL